MSKRDLSAAELAASADRCTGCYGANSKRVCDAVKSQGGCRVAANASGALVTLEAILQKGSKNKGGK